MHVQLEREHNAVIKKGESGRMRRLPRLFQAREAVETREAAGVVAFLHKFFEQLCLKCVTNFVLYCCGRRQRER